MKILLDQNISYRLVSKIKPIFPGIDHVKNVGLTNKLDKIIWDYAKREGFTIATFDSDFYDLSMLFEHPPKLIWINPEIQLPRILLEFLLRRQFKFKILFQKVSWAA